MAVSDIDIDVSDHTQQLGAIIHSNQTIRRHVQLAVNDFLDIRKKLLGELKAYGLDQIDQLKPFAETMNIQTLNKQVTAEKVQLALCGENSSGKTSFLHTFLGIGNILPSGVGPVTARIVKLTYADAKHSCIRIFRSFEDSLEQPKPKIIEEIDLSSFFMDNDQIQSNGQDSVGSADWKGIMNTLEEYLKRHANMDANSTEFAEWARHFVEIHLPSPTLKWNIDVYDTPGFLFNDAPVLKDILRNMVSQVHPTLVFLYDNASTSDDMNDCYLAMKSALKQPDSTSIFYLNTKSDIDHIPNVTDDTTMEQFKAVLAEERAKRYDLLRKAPCLGKDTLNGLPPSVDDCNCFDICSVISHEDPLGAHMNHCAIRRLVQFVANSDLVVAKRVTSIVLPAIEAFFDLALIISHRTPDQLQQLRSNALLWHSTFLREHQKHFNTFLTDVFGLILQELNKNRVELIRDASKRKDKESIELYMHVAVKHKVVREVLSAAISKAVSAILDMLLSNRDLMANASSNELLVAALRTETTEALATYANESVTQATVQYYMLNNITTPIMLVAQILFGDDHESGSETVKGLLQEIQRARSTASASISTNRNNIFDPKFEAQQCLSAIESRFTGEKSTLEFILGLWKEQQVTKLTEKINELYKSAQKLLPLRNKAHELVQRYASSFARIYCRLHAAQDFAKFDGKEPIIRNDESQSTVYSIYRATWGKQNKLVVKVLSQPVVNKPDITYFEGQYHLKVRSLNIPYIVDISYLYEKVLPDKACVLWMFFPAFERNLKDFMEQSNQQVPLNKAVDMITRITTALACLHQNEIVHRNVIASNIVIDSSDRAYLIDLGNWSADENYDITTRHDSSTTEDGILDDIHALGKLGLDLLLCVESAIQNTDQQSRLDTFKKVMHQCTSATADEPISTQTVQTILRSIQTA